MFYRELYKVEVLHPINSVNIINDSFQCKKEMSMIRKYHNYTLHTNPRHREKEPQIINNNNTSVRQLQQSNQLSLPLQDHCRTRMDTK